jgi:hypothetical protein
LAYIQETSSKEENSESEHFDRNENHAYIFSHWSWYISVTWFVRRYLSNYSISLCNFKYSLGYSGQGAGTVINMNQRSKEFLHRWHTVKLSVPWV